MKWRNIFVLMIFVTIFSACYDEDKIIPLESDDEILRYEFPQGENAWDQDIVEISEQFGVYLIYKNFKENDFNRSWTGSGLGGTLYYGYDLTDEQAEFSTNFMKNHIFAHLNKAIVNKVLPMYWYMVYDYHTSTEFIPGMAFKVAQRFYDEGLDFWGICLFYGDPCPLTGETIETPETPEEFRLRRCATLGEIFQESFDKGNFVIPTGFTDGFDYKTEVLSNDADKLDENYYIMRGFPGIMDPDFDGFSPVYKNPTPLNQHFMEYIKIAMRYTKAEYEEMWPSATYRLIHEKRQFVIDYMKNTYGVDLEKIAELIGE
ncbi:MAG TPA: putative zinc-binding metallopeptidase [Candidatus Butyricimonas faecavium]|nr:putative zinc-binding metallopeptidase [Candidatus Butyricimonas faecavium]